MPGILPGAHTPANLGSFRPGCARADVGRRASRVRSVQHVRVVQACVGLSPVKGATGEAMDCDRCYGAWGNRPLHDTGSCRSNSRTKCRTGSRSRAPETTYTAVVVPGQGGWSRRWSRAAMPCSCRSAWSSPLPASPLARVHIGDQQRGNRANGNDNLSFRADVHQPADGRDSSGRWRPSGVDPSLGQLALTQPYTTRCRVRSR
jgi:hypothetical protein